MAESTTSSPTTAPSGAASISEKLADFSDKLSPMLVKELRQGMRTNLFTVAFILIQAFMVLCMLMSLGNSDSEATTVFFWMIIGIALLIVQPIRGFNALSSEMLLNTMDLIQMTRLSAARITFGKWASIVAQSLLLLTGVLPYVVLRYYQGGINVIGELAAIFWLFLGSILLTAMTVGFSSFKSVLLRVALLIGIGVTVMVSLAGFSFSRAIGSTMGGSSSTSFGIPVWEIAATIIVAVYATYYFLDLGASRIAPESANHSSRKRVISLLFMIVMLVLPIFGLNPQFGVAMSMIVFVLVGIDSITESPSVLPGVLRPFAKNALTRFAAKFLTPGWHTGIRFFVLMGIVLVAGLFGNIFMDTGTLDDFVDLEGWIVVASLVATLTFPLIIIHLFFFPVTYSQFYFGLYILIQVCTGALGLFVMSVAGASGALNPILYICFPVPFVNFLAVEPGNNDDLFFLIASCVFFFFSLFIPNMRSRPIFKRMHQTFKAIDEGTEDAIGEQTERQIIPKGAD